MVAGQSQRSSVQTTTPGKTLATPWFDSNQKITMNLSTKSCSVLDHDVICLVDSNPYSALNLLSHLVILSRKLHSTLMVPKKFNFSDIHVEYISFPKLGQSVEKLGQNLMHGIKTTCESRSEYNVFRTSETNKLQTLFPILT